jgi:glutamate dehydrogenase/leucine dehydrogenase
VPGLILERGILYAPDYVINAGGLISVYVELHGGGEERALALMREIYGRLRDVFALARDLGIPTSGAAERMVEQRLAEGRQRRRATADIDSEAVVGAATVR